MNLFRRVRAFRFITFRQLLAVGITTRLAADTTNQLFNPFLRSIALGAGLSVVEMGRLVSLRAGMGLFAPFFGALADRYSYRQVMRGGLLTAAIGMYMIGWSNGGGWLVLGMILTGLGMGAFVPTLQAYMSARLPYAQRARGIGILEYSWALAGIIGLQSVGILIERTGWRSPFLVLGSGLLLGWILFGFLPSARSERSAAPPQSAPLWKRGLGFFRLGANARSAYALILANGLFFYGQFHILIIHGAWLQTEYGLSDAALGTVALIQGFADLGGSVLVSVITDQIGKRRSVLAGMFGALLAYLLLPIANVALVSAVVVIALMRFTFEFAIVSNISFVSEQVPEQRGKVMTLSAALSLLGVTLAGFTGPEAYVRYGVLALGLPAAILTSVAILLIYWRVREVEPDSASLQTSDNS